MLAHVVHCELLGLVQVSAVVQKSMSVHATHGPGLPSSQDPGGQDKHSFAVGPLHVAHDGSHAAKAPVGNSDRTQAPTRTSSLPMGADLNRLVCGLSSEIGTQQG